MQRTHHSEFGRLDLVYIKRAADAFISDECLEKDWEALHYEEKPSFKAALAEYANFESILREYAAEIRYFPLDAGVNIDSIYCRDASIPTNWGVILCNMGKLLRRGEPEAAGRTYLAHGIPVLGRIEPPGTLEGGDLLWLDESTLAVAHSYRTNPAGIAQLQQFLQPMGVDVITVPLPHYKGARDVFHLMSICSPLDHHLSLVYSPLMPIVFREYLIEKGHQLIELPEDEFDSMGCNVLALSPRICLIAAGNPRTRRLLEENACKVIEYPGREISVRGGGGPTCLTRPLTRFE